MTSSPVGDRDRLALTTPRFSGSMALVASVEIMDPRVVDQGAGDRERASGRPTNSGEPSSTGLIPVVILDEFLGAVILALTASGKVSPGLPEIMLSRIDRGRNCPHTRPRARAQMPLLVLAQILPVDLENPLGPRLIPCNRRRSRFARAALLFPDDAEHRPLRIEKLPPTVPGLGAGMVTVTSWKRSRRHIWGAILPEARRSRAGRFSTAPTSRPPR